MADPFLESGLTNRVFRVDTEDPAALRAEWGDELNEFHLFRELKLAARFRSFADARSPEHAPYCAYGMWNVAEVVH